MQINLRFVLETLWQKGRRQNLKPVLLSDPTAKKGMGHLQKKTVCSSFLSNQKSSKHKKKYLCIYLRASGRATKKYKF